MRASLQGAREACDSELKRLGRSAQATDSAEAYPPVKAIALSSPGNVALGRDWDYQNAHFRLRATDAHKEALRIMKKCCSLQLPCALPISRSLVAFLRARLEGAFPGRRLLRQPRSRDIGGWPSSDYQLFYKAATAHGVAFGGAFALRECWGLNLATTSHRIIHGSSSGLHSLAMKSGAWPVKMPGAHTACSPFWITNYLFGFANQLPMERKRHLDVPPSSTSDEEAPGARRKRELEESGARSFSHG